MKRNRQKASILFCVALFVFSFLFIAHAKTSGYLETDLVVNKQVNAVPTLVRDAAIPPSMRA